jgi:hypothetical protein
MQQFRQFLEFRQILAKELNLNSKFFVYHVVIFTVKMTT